MTDLQGAWVSVVFLIVVVSVLDIVVQSAALHSALGQAKIHSPQLAGLGLLSIWIPTTAVWIAAGIALGHQTVVRCTAADVSAIWLGALYPFTAWPAILQARRAGVRVAAWYWFAQFTIGLALAALGGFPCL